MDFLLSVQLHFTINLSNIRFFSYKKEESCSSILYGFLFITYGTDRFIVKILNSITFSAIVHNAYSVCILPPARKNPATLPVKICHVTGFPCQ
jgi:hypothetical protein